MYPSLKFNNYYYYLQSGLRNKYSNRRLATTSSMTVTLELRDWARLTEIAHKYKFNSLSKAIKVCVAKYPTQ